MLLTTWQYSQPSLIEIYSFLTVELPIARLRSNPSDKEGKDCPKRWSALSEETQHTRSRLASHISSEIRTWFIFFFSHISLWTELGIRLGRDWGPRMEELEGNPPHLWSVFSPALSINTNISSREIHNPPEQSTLLVHTDAFRCMHSPTEIKICRQWKHKPQGEEKACWVINFKFLSQGIIFNLHQNL